MKPPANPVIAVQNGRRRARLSNEADPETGVAGPRLRLIDGDVLASWASRGVIDENQHQSAADFRAIFQLSGLAGQYRTVRLDGDRIDAARSDPEGAAVVQAHRRRKVAGILDALGPRVRTAAVVVIGEGRSLSDLAGHLRTNGVPCSRDEARGLVLAAVEAIHRALAGPPREARPTTDQPRRPLVVPDDRG